MVDFHDTLILDGKARRLQTGELAASVRCARHGLQDYAGYEVGKPELKRVTVYRPESEVMKRDSLITFAGVPVTNEHPRESVTTDNWKRYAVGESGDEVVRDGEFIRVPILVRDEAAIKAIQDGKRQISMGYSCSLSFEDGIAPDGTAYQAVQRDIKINHLAIVDRARGGPALVVDDQRTYNLSDGSDNNADQRRETDFPSGGGNVTRDGAEKMKFMLVDGLQVEVTDQAEAAINKLLGQVKDEREGRAADKSTHDKAMATKDGEIDTLKKQVIDQAGIDKLADAKASVVADAKAIVGDKLGDTKGKSVSDVRRMACTAAGIDVADKSDDYVEARFDTLKDAKPDTLRDAITNHPRPVTNDSGASVRDLARAAQY